jgi:hypothetical protein
VKKEPNGSQQKAKRDEAAYKALKKEFGGNKGKSDQGKGKK